MSTVKRALEVGQVVFLRSFSTNRGAIAEIVELGEDMSQIRLVSRYYDWDSRDLPGGQGLLRGEEGQTWDVATYRLEPVYDK